MRFEIPFAFKPNRVKRLYSGGSGIERLRGAASPEDSNCPEDWIASCVEANSKNVPPGHGLSFFVCEGEDVLFKDALLAEPSAILGPEHFAAFGANPAFLAKLLDSAARLPLQAHPDRASAMKLFKSPYGKSEAWMIFSVREIDGVKPYILLGFNESLDEKLFKAESLAGDYVSGLSMLHKFEVEPGDVYLVPGRVPHAIGPGVTMVEAMEPTDITINPERLCCGVELPPERRFAKLSPETALDVFEYVPRSREEVLAACHPAPVEIERRPEGSLRRLISRDSFKFFEAQELSFGGRWPLSLEERQLRVGVVTEGSVSALHSGGELNLKAGSSFFVPYACEKCVFEGSGRILMLLPPNHKR